MPPRFAPQQIAPAFNLQPVADNIQQNQIMESMSEIATMQPVDPSRVTMADLKPHQLKQIQDYVEGREAQPPVIPGFTPPQMQQNPWAVPNPYNPYAQAVFGQPLPPQLPPHMQALLAQANMQAPPQMEQQIPQQQYIDPNAQQWQQYQQQAPVVPQAPVAGPNYAEMMKPIIDAMQAQTQAMVAPLVQSQQQQQQLLSTLLSGQQQYYHANADAIRAQQIQAAGLSATEPVHIAVYNLAEQNQQLQAQLQQMQQNFQFLQQQAQQHVTESQFRQQIAETVSAKWPKVKIPEPTLKSVAKTAAALSASMGAEHAVKAALEGLMPVFEQLSAIPQTAHQQRQPPVQQFQQSWAPPLHPGLQQLQQFPQFAGLTAEQLAGVYAGMQATAMGGNGAGRHQERVTLDQLDSMLFN